MIHPFNNEIHLAMENETPQTEREWRIIFRGEIDKLSNSIDGLTKTVHDFMENEISELRKDIAKLQRFETEVMSSWKTVMAVAAIVGALLGIIAKAIL